MIGLLRIGNCAMAGFAAVIGAGIVYDMTEIPVPGAILLFSSVFLITGAGNAINDFFDAEIDAINKPMRPIPSGRLSRTSALYFSIALFGAGVVLASLINTICLAIAILNSVLLILYARNLKQRALVGNVCIGFLTGSTFLFGGALFGTCGIVRTAGLFALAMLATTAREIAKDIEDVDGDSALGLDTLPIRVGKERAGFLASAIGSITVMLSPLPYLAGFSAWYMLVIVFADLCFFFAMLRLMRGDAAGSSRLFKGGMAIALAAFVVGSVGGTPIVI